MSTLLHRHVTNIWRRCSPPTTKQVGNLFISFDSIASFFNVKAVTGCIANDHTLFLLSLLRGWELIFQEWRKLSHFHRKKKIETKAIDMTCQIMTALVESCPKVWHVSAIFGRLTYFSAIVGIIRQRYGMKQEHPIYDHVRQTSAIFGNLMIWNRHISYL